MSAARLRLTSSTPSCSGSSAPSINLARHMCSLCRAPRNGMCSSVVVQALYNFADSAEVRLPGQRRNRGLLKKEAREVMDVVRGLTSMSAKQLAAVSHLLPPGTVEAVGIAARLPRSNQGRKRQEGLVAKLLRGQLTEQQMEKLEAAVTVATDHRGIYDDADVSGLVEVWQEGLLAGDEAVVAEVYGYQDAWVHDQQQLRALVRQCQQALEEEHDREAAQLQIEALTGSAAAVDSGSSRSSSDGDTGDEEDLAAVLAEAAVRSGGGGGRGRHGSKAPEPRSRGLLRSLRRMLRPLATRVVQESGAAV